MTELFGLDEELTLEDLDKETFNTHLYKNLQFFLFFINNSYYFLSITSKFVY